MSIQDMKPFSLEFGTLYHSHLYLIYKGGDHIAFHLVRFVSQPNNSPSLEGRNIKTSTS
jgi:hypothetical protein